ncbi:uncharacterized protein LOC130135943 [Syzygium oleosum]|uniref:uncharacterized protein LOC130135943 n=1 Tax=Syzygium oleosum TaxID=219896 RepID=UPI0024B8BF4A|nr:uncharacterized protein LOC130135943 [Syzygium oleosum]
MASKRIFLGLRSRSGTRRRARISRRILLPLPALKQSQSRIPVPTLVLPSESAMFVRNSFQKFVACLLKLRSGGYFLFRDEFQPKMFFGFGLDQGNLCPALSLLECFPS